MTHFIRMMVIAAGIAGLSTVADAGTHINAGWYNGIHLNGLIENGTRMNALGGNGVKVNAIAASGIWTAADARAVQGLIVIGFDLPIR